MRGGWSRAPECCVESAPPRGPLSVRPWSGFRTRRRRRRLRNECAADALPPEFLPPPRPRFFALRSLIFSPFFSNSSAPWSSTCHHVSPLAPPQFSSRRRHFLPVLVFHCRHRKKPTTHPSRSVAMQCIFVGIKKETVSPSYLKSPRQGRYLSPYQDQINAWLVD